MVIVHNDIFIQDSEADGYRGFPVGEPDYNQGSDGHWVPSSWTKGDQLGYERCQILKAA